MLGTLEVWGNERGGEERVGEGKSFLRQERKANLVQFVQVNVLKLPLLLRKSL